MNNEISVNAKPVLDQNNIPIEELFGSVTTYNNVEGSDCKSQQLRTSARVFKKMKLDLAIVASTSTETKKVEVVKEEVKPETKKPLFRPSWSQEDKNLFFEALNEFGKDFESIYSYITNKLKKKGLPDSVMKTKDQVRHFYYRTWHKISKHLKFSDDIKKLAQELYGLINYGELRKKIGSVSEKTCMKLNELIYRGALAIRTKGKTLRIRTPMCRALRKLNQLDEKHDDLKLPTRVNVDLIPKDMNTWLYIQGLSQNPRIKAVLSLQKRLSTLIKFLSCKWKTASAVAYENAVTPTNTVVTDCVPEKKVIEDNKTILEPCLRLAPPSKTHIELPTINLSEYLTSHSICLNAFEARVGVKTPGEQLWFVKWATRKGSTKRSRNESSNEKLLQVNNRVINTDNNENCIKEPELSSNVDEVIDQAVNTLLALQETGAPTVLEKNKEVKEDLCEDVKKEEFINNIRNGWTSYTCGTLSIGELYLMFGSNSKLTLQYSWDHLENETKTDVKNCDSMNVVDNQEQPVSNKILNVTENDGHKSNDSLTGTLERLLSIAKLQYRKNIVHCPCGHVCGTNKPNATTKKLTVTKVVDKNTDLAEKQTPSDNSSMSMLKNSSVTPIVPVVIQAPVRQFSPTTAFFRRPISPNDSLRAQLDSIQRLPRYCNRRGRRPRSKPVVVERRLSLLPNKNDSGRQIVQMNIISHKDISPGFRSIAPKIVQLDKAEHNITKTVSVDHGTNVAPTIANKNVKDASANFDSELIDINNTVPPNTIDMSDNAVTPSRVGSPTSISNLLELALVPQNDQLLENKDDSSIPSFVGLLSNNIASTPPTSPSRILKENENTWLNSEVADFSLSSFLGHLESPTKSTNYSTGTSTDDTHLSQDVDAQLQSLLTESSVDYMAKFADLAAQVVSDVKK